MSTRAHTVPRFYLNGFVAPASKLNRDPFLFIGSVTTGLISRRSPKNVSINRGFYDGPGGLLDPKASIEDHLSKIEWAAASAIRKLAGTPNVPGQGVPAEVWRFLSWQAARTPAWVEIAERYLREWDPNAVYEMVEPPPEGMEDVEDRPREIGLELPATGERRVAKDIEEFKSLHAHGWKWAPSTEDRLEMIHMQAWYFQVRHFPRFYWRRLDVPAGEAFVTSDRAVVWNVGGRFDSAPSALRYRSAEVIAPLTASIALVGRHSTEPFAVTPSEINRLTVMSAAEWIAGPTEAVVAHALSSRMTTSGGSAG